LLLEYCGILNAENGFNILRLNFDSVTLPQILYIYRLVIAAVRPDACIDVTDQ